MQARALLILGVALLLGALTVTLMHQYLQTQVVDTEPAEEVRSVPVVIAGADLGTGQRLAREGLRLVDWPEDAVPEGAFTSIEALLGERPPVVLTDIRRSEPIMAHRLSPHGARGGLPARIPEDMRATTVSTNEIRGVAGFVQPGDYVDVLHTTTLGRVDNRPVTRLILKNVRVLGIDQQSATEDDETHVARATTLLVSPPDGQRLALAQRTGEISFMLRNELDASIVEAPVISFRELLTDYSPPVVVTERVRRVPEVEVIRGLDVTRELVEEGEPVDDAD